MDDFDLTNCFFYSDEIACITELCVAIRNFQKQTNVTPQNSPESNTTNPMTIEEIQTFCSANCKYSLTSQVVSKYLLTDNLYTLAYLESQKYGNLKLSHATDKFSVPFNFTNRASHYGPNTVGHIQNILRMRPHENEVSCSLWTENQRTELGHRRPQDQALEAGMSCSVKNDFRVGTPTNVINRAATVQERSVTEQNLKDELFITRGQLNPTSHTIDINRKLLLRAAWRKALQHIVSKEIILQQLPDEDCVTNTEGPEFHPLHNPDKVINKEVIREKEMGESCLFNYIEVKEQQEKAFMFKNP